jgi:hypothetical protein
MTTRAGQVMIIVVIEVDMAASTRIAEGVQPTTKWDGMAVLLAEETHTNKFAVPDIVSTIMAPGASSSALIQLLTPQVVKAFNGVASNAERDGFIIR